MPQKIHAESRQPSDAPLPQAASTTSWLDGAYDLIASRIALLQLEAKDAASKNLGRALMVAGAAFAALLFWVLLLTATTGIIHMLVGFAWYWTCLILAVIHLLAGIALLRAARTPGRPAFQHTIAEFQKDREWLQNLQNRKFKP